MLLFDAQRRDCELRLSKDFAALPRRRQLRLLRVCARDRSGHAITVLTGFVAPRIEFSMLPHLFTAGALIMHIDDHGDCYADLRDGRLTYLNQVRNPRRRCASCSSSTWPDCTRAFRRATAAI